MTDGFVVETGEGLPESNSYVDLDEASAYYRVRGYTLWFDLTADIQQAVLISATLFVDTYYDWAGYKRYDDQALEFPRTGIKNPVTKLEIDDVPNVLQRIVLEAAKKIVTKDGDSYVINDLLPDNASNPIKKIREKFADMETETTYMTATEQGENYSLYPMLDRMVPKYLLQIPEKSRNYPVSGTYFGSQGRS